MTQKEEPRVTEIPSQEEEAQDKPSPEKEAAAEQEVSCAEKKEALKAENAELNDQILRIRADSENYRKRMSRQRQDDYKYRHQDILKDLADVIDNFERALLSSGESQDTGAFLDGILMIEKQFSGMLKDKYGLERMGRKGDVFDPSIHEAISMEESAEVTQETVLEVLQPGYRLHDRPLRAAKVQIAKPVTAPPEGESGESVSENKTK